MRHNLRGYLTIKTAAQLLGVSPKTLRNWDRSGKLKPCRHPLNGYRLYRQDELESLLEDIAVSSKRAGKVVESGVKSRQRTENE